MAADRLAVAKADSSSVTFTLPLFRFGSGSHPTLLSSEPQHTSRFRMEIPLMRFLASVPLPSLRIVALFFAGSLGLSVAHAEATVTLAWDANTDPNVTGYVLSYGVAPGQYTRSVDVGSQTAYQFSEPDPTATYYFAVRAYNAAGLF